MTRPVPRCPEFGRTYGQGCRCSFCRADKSKRMNEYRLRKSAATRGQVTEDTLVDAAALRRRIVRYKREHGRGVQNELARAAGVRRETVNSIANGKQRRCALRTYRALMRILEYPEFRPESDHPRGWVPNRRSQQIIRSLQAQGWTAADLRLLLHEHRGISGWIVRSALRTTYIYRENADHLEWLAGFVGSAAGPSPALAARMQRAGYLPLQHYTPRGDLDESTLAAEQRVRLQQLGTDRAA